MKAIPLIEAILKSFVRDKKAILLLIIAPLILIIIIFLSFSTTGLQKIPVGVIGHTESFDVKKYESSFLSFLKTEEYISMDACLKDIKSEGLYMCIEVIEGESTIVNMYYDNTHEPVIWEVIERIKTSVDMAQKEQTKHMAEEFLQKFRSTSTKVGTFRQRLLKVNEDIDLYIIQIDRSIADLGNAKTELSNNIYSMDRDISEAEDTKQSMKEQRDDMYKESISYLNYMDTSLNQMTNLSYNDYLRVQEVKNQNNMLRSEVNNYKSMTDQDFRTFDYKISNYKAASSRGKEMLYKMDRGISGLQKTKSDLGIYKSNISSTDKEIASVMQEFDMLQKLNPEMLVNSIIIKSRPTYIPEARSKYLAEIAKMNESEQAKTINKGIDMISLQTIFPTILFLIILFLSLLISTFICLGEINGTANQRKNLVKSIFFPELISIFVASGIIILIPTFILMAMGDYFFKIDIFGNFLSIAIILTMVISIFILAGMILAYIFKQESITLLVTTFMLVLLIFFSGFVFSSERMSDVSFKVSMNSPSKIGILSFNKIAFYNQSLSSIEHYIILLLGWIVILSAIVIIIKKLRT